ncbi:MAG: DUF5329 family protein [Spirochaetes bacterium]|nr:DUF5329 family protein [Spirochaetota bacterium]
MKTGIIIALILMSGPMVYATQETSESGKIAALIEGIRGMKGARFIRNGSEYPPGEAADHLAMKRRKAGDRVRTARQFIELVASRSYLSGEEYLIRLPDGKVVSSRAVLEKMLREIESGKAGSPRG